MGIARSHPYDMSGNAMEWVEDVYDGTFYDALEEKYASKKS